MDKTGKKFDMNPDTFTLQNLFAMELHNYTETIGDIVGMAMKELSIEKVTHKMQFREKCFLDFHIFVGDILGDIFYHIKNWLFLSRHVQ